MEELSPVTVRSIAVPTEHGGWGFTLEPIILGLAISPNTAGFLIGAAALLAFLARRPLRMVLTDRRLQRRIPRTRVAERVVGFEIAAATAAIIGAVLLADDASLLLPLTAAAPLAAVQVWADATLRSRDLIPELAGGIALGSVAVAITLAGGVDAADAWGLWLVPAGRTVSTVPFVRAQIRRSRNLPSRAASVMVVDAAVLGVMMAAAWIGTVPWAAAAAMGFLWVWSAVWLARPPIPTRTLGWTQMLVGLIVVAATAAGYHAGW
jgi:hypothetical protein